MNLDLTLYHALLSNEVPAAVIDDDKAGIVPGRGDGAAVCRVETDLSSTRRFDPRSKRSYALAVSFRNRAPSCSGLND